MVLVTQRNRAARSNGAWSVKCLVFFTLLTALALLSWCIAVVFLTGKEPEIPSSLHLPNLRSVEETLGLLAPSPNGHTFNPVLRHLSFCADTLFDHLIANHPNPTSTSVVIEVGCHRLAQSAFASALGFKTLSFDASPQNFAIMKKEYDSLPASQQRLMTLYNNAVSARSGDHIGFAAIGGTGDHVAGIDIDAGKQKYSAKPNNAEVVVDTMSLDDVISSLTPQEQVYLVKIDVQGHEASVFAGLAQSILSQNPPRYILFEYWVDALDQAKSLPFGSCSSVEDILIPLSTAGYELFDLSVMAHPKGGKRVTDAFLSHFFRPLDYRENCRWFAQRGLEDRSSTAREETYEMGYWTDVLAVYKGEFGLIELGTEQPIQGRRPISEGTRYITSLRKDVKGWERMTERRANAGRTKWS